MNLLETIHDWLVAQRQHLVDKGLWSWGVQAFWIAFTAAYPAFPHGEWPRWNSVIPLQGLDIEDWLQCTDDDDGCTDGTCNVEDESGLQVAWEQLQELISSILASH